MAAVNGLVVVTVGSMIANLCSYLVHLPASRWLGPGPYGEFATLLQLSLVFAVPSLALQTVVARQVVRGAGARQLRRLAAQVAAGALVLAALAVPIAAVALHTSIAATAAALAQAPVLVLLAAEQGLLQGARRFRRLAVVLAVAGVAKVAPTVPVLAVGGGAGGGLAAMTCGAAVAAILARTAVGAAGEGHGAGTTVIAVLSASGVQLVLIAFTSIDLLLSRPVLGPTAAGTYALGAVATKVAFWLPQAVGVVFYPHLASPERSRGALRTVLTVLVSLTVLCAAGAAVCAPVATMLAGNGYAPVQPWLWLFAVDGGLLAVMQGVLLYAIAAERTRIALFAWAGFAVEAALLLTVPHTVGAMIAVSASCVGVTAAACAVAAALHTETAAAQHR
ncbi:polysaccharide biosynthesis protein [Tsukamurella sp. 8F]|uniref:polysaccharide biosynthesis protein n=1 Tax=unclassified Tsukamurella TaxID=2633480 RepID=UPI0023B9785D|nr:MULTISPECIES: polysaccharide biosynthesis protein [unclassified Tsukamurella]MDF0529883.1 polysaccharide biosynthesis protein [Tsukamurella sp. 8J]MDF0588662.1 polysaccharide biosynthesis protein [Tsukamurella sp. 8F]